MRHWFIGDSVIVRYENEMGGPVVRIHPSFEGKVRKYRCSYFVDGHEGKFTEWSNLIDALKQGEEWLP